MPFRPLVIQGHTRPVTRVYFNYDCDLLITCGADAIINVQFTNTGKRLGTMQHDGFISDCTISQDSKHLITVSHDWTLRIWDLYAGKELTQYKYGRKPTAVTFASGCSMFAVGVEPSNKNTKAICYIYDFDCYQNSEEALLRDFPNPQNGNFTALAFSIDNTYLFLTDDKGYFHVYVCIEEEEEEDTTQSNNNSNEKEEKSESNKDKTAVETKESGTAITTSLKLHTDAILSLKLSRNKAMALVTSLDQSATLLDIRDGKNIRILQKFTSDRPLRGGVISPIKNHIILGGGQDAHLVTTTDESQAGFDIEFWHIVYNERLASLPAHFGTVRTLDLSNDGKMLASGAEDGYIRLWHFDDKYLSSNY